MDLPFVLLAHGLQFSHFRRSRPGSFVLGVNLLALSCSSIETHPSFTPSPHRPHSFFRLDGPSFFCVSPGEKIPLLWNKLKPPRRHTSLLSTLPLSGHSLTPIDLPRSDHKPRRQPASPRLAAAAAAVASSATHPSSSNRIDLKLGASFPAVITSLLSPDFRKAAQSASLPPLSYKEFPLSHCSFKEESFDPRRSFPLFVVVVVVVLLNKAFFSHFKGGG